MQKRSNSVDLFTKKVMDYMTDDYICVDSKETIGTATQQLRDEKKSTLIIQNEQGVCGVITEKDIATKVVFQMNENTPVDQIMSAPVKYVFEDELRFKDEYGKISQTGSTTEKFMETSRIRHDAESRVREEIRTIQTINFGGDTIIGDWNTSFQISHSFAEQDDSNNADVTFRCDLRAGKDNRRRWSVGCVRRW